MREDRRARPLCVWVTFIDELASYRDTTVSMVSTIVPEEPALADVQDRATARRRPRLRDGDRQEARLTYERFKERIRHEGVPHVRDRDFDLKGNCRPIKTLTQDLGIEDAVRRNGAGRQIPVRNRKESRLIRFKQRRRYDTLSSGILKDCWKTLRLSGTSTIRGGRQ